MVGDDLGGAARLFDDSIFDVGIGPQLGDLFIGRVVLVSVLDCDDVEVWIGRLAGGIILVENLVAVQSGICGKVVIDDGTIDAFEGGSSLGCIDRLNLRLGLVGDDISGGV